MDTIFVVERQSVDGVEYDYFTDYLLATRWARITHSRVTEEPILTHDDVRAMEQYYPSEMEDSNTWDS